MTATAARRPITAAILASAGCSLLFVVVYSATNALAATREQVGTFYYDWERYIPLVPWMILPYMSIDAFFVASPFICTDVREIKTLARRVCSAIIVAGLFFLFWPLELWFERSPVEGALGKLFDFLRDFDHPYNLFPSLHITLIFILRWTYHRHVRGGWRCLMHLWFALVTASTILTHQHQVIDLLGGLVLAILVFHVFPTGLIYGRDPKVKRAPSPTLAGYYGGASLLLLLLAWIASSWTWTVFWLLVWAATALLLVALGYGWLGPRVFRKYAGYLSIPARILLVPYLLALWWTRRLYWKQETQAHVEIRSGVSFGRLPDPPLARQLLDSGVTAVLDLCAEHSEVALLRQAPIQYCNLPIMDLVLPEKKVLQAAVEFIEAQRQAGKVYVHCALGYERSATAVAAWLLRTGQVEDANAAVQAVRSARSERIPKDRLHAALAEMNS